MIVSYSSDVWYACGGIYELQSSENCMSKKLDSSRFTGPKGLKMAKIETFRDISRNVEIKALWSSELRTVVIVASFC